MKYVLVRGGALSMKMDGHLVTLKLHVDNWDLKVLNSYGMDQTSVGCV